MRKSADSPGSVIKSIPGNLGQGFFSVLPCPDVFFLLNTRQKFYLSGGYNLLDFTDNNVEPIVFLTWTPTLTCLIDQPSTTFQVKNQMTLHQTIHFSLEMCWLAEQRGQIAISHNFNIGDYESNMIGSTLLSIKLIRLYPPER